MGKRWRRFNERVRQQLMAPHFQPVSTERNQMMFREASTYFQHFKTVIKKLTKLMKDYEDVTSSVRSLLECRVPRLYTVETDGSVGAELLDGDAFLGSGIELDRLTSTSQSLQARMSEEVYGTIHQWFRSYERCKALLTALEELKFECDSRRRTVLTLDARRLEFAGKVKKGDRAREAMLKHTEEKLEHKQNKSELCAAEFEEKEEEVNQAMRALLSEVQILSELIGHIFQILSDAPGDAHKSFKGAVSGYRSTGTPAPKVNKKKKSKNEAPSVDKTNPFLGPTSMDVSNPFLRASTVDKTNPFVRSNESPF